MNDMISRQMKWNVTPLGLCMIRRLKMRNGMLSMKDDSGVIFINDKSKNIWDLMHYVCSSIWEIPLFHHEGTDAYIQWQDNDRYVCIALPWRLLILTGVRPKELPEYARRTRKVAQRCANWLVSSYLHVWSVCRVYGTCPNYPLEQYRRKTDWKIGPIISFACDCCI